MISVLWLCCNGMFHHANSIWGLHKIERENPFKVLCPTQMETHLTARHSGSEGDSDNKAKNFKCITISIIILESFTTAVVNIWVQDNSHLWRQEKTQFESKRFYLILKPHVNECTQGYFFHGWDSVMLHLHCNLMDGGSLFKIIIRILIWATTACGSWLIWGRMITFRGLFNNSYDFGTLAKSWCWSYRFCWCWPRPSTVRRRYYWQITLVTCNKSFTWTPAQFPQSRHCSQAPRTNSGQLLLVHTWKRRLYCTLFQQNCRACRWYSVWKITWWLLSDSWQIVWTFW